MSIILIHTQINFAFRLQISPNDDLYYRLNNVNLNIITYVFSN